MKYLLPLFLLTGLLSFAANAQQIKISNLPDGGNLQANDVVPIVRSGVTYKGTFIGSGITAAAPSTLGGVFQLTATSNYFLTGLTATGGFTSARPSCSSLSDAGTGCSATLGTAAYTATSDYQPAHATLTALTIGTATLSSGSVASSLLSGTVAVALLPTFTATTNGIVTSSGGGTSNYLRADGDWASPVTAVSLDSIVGISGTTNIFKGIMRMPDTTYTNQNQYLYNADPQYLSKFRDCVQAVHANTGDCIVLGMGDSNMLGISTSTGGVWQNLTTNISRNLNRAGIASHAAGWFGGSTEHGDAGSRETDTSMTMGGWTFSTGLTTLGGALLSSSATGAPFVWAPRDNYGNSLIIDTVDIYHTCAEDQADATLVVNGASTTIPLSTCGSFTTVKTTATGPRGPALINLYHDTSTAGSFILGMVPKDSAHRQVIFVNAGWSGSTSAQTADSSAFYSPVQSIGLLDPDVAISQWGILDIAATTATATFKSNVQTILTAVATGGGDNILLTPRPVNDNLTLAPEYYNIILDLAKTNNSPLIHNWARWGGLLNNAPASFIADDYHPTPAGYGDLAVAPSQMLIGVLGVGSPIETMALDSSQHLRIHGDAAPTVSTCGNGPPSVAGNDVSMLVTTGTGTPTACTVTFAKVWPTIPVCVVTPQANVTTYLSATSTAAFTVTLSAGTDSAKLGVHCFGYY